jgi:sterol desaturase/sphingolipid hydroxylase (fatty acid hydroxylase superfamily)
MFTVIVLVAAYVLVPPVELLLSGRSKRLRRANLGMIAPTMIASGLVGAALAGVATYGHAHGVGLAPWLDLPHAIELALVVALFDLAAYVDHRLRHRITLLWRIHRAHHTDTEVDVTTSLRNHPLDVAMIVAVSSFATLALGASPEAVALSGAIGVIFAVWDHLRIALPGRLERALSTVIQTPGMHRVHHAPDRPRTDSNFGLIFSIWDHVFGTFSPPDPHCPVGLDTADLAKRQSVRAMLADPWRHQVSPFITRFAGRLPEEHPVALVAHAAGHRDLVSGVAVVHDPAAIVARGEVDRDRPVDVPALETEGVVVDPRHLSTSAPPDVEAHV